MYADSVWNTEMAQNHTIPFQCTPTIYINESSGSQSFLCTGYIAFQLYMATILYRVFKVEIPQRKVMRNIIATQGKKKQSAAKHCSNGKIHKTVFNTISSFGVFFHETANGKIMPTNMPICDCSSAFQRNSHICKRRNILFYFIFERNLTQKKQHEARDFISKFTCDFTDLLFIAWQIWTHNHWILSLEKWRNSFHFNFVLLSHYWNKSFFTRFYEVHITNGIWKGMPIIE